jgi:hypothetical protein
VEKLAYFKNYEKEAGRAQGNKKKLLSCLVMTVDAIEESLLNRKKKLTHMPEQMTKSALKYEGWHFALDGQAVAPLRGNKKTFDDLPKTFDMAMLQLDACNHYLLDFTKIIK